jgi:transcription termination factor NusA
MATRESPTAMFQRTLGMEPRIADALIAAGIETLEELAYVPINELLSIEALKDSEAQYFRHRDRLRPATCESGVFARHRTETRLSSCFNSP